MPGQQQFHRAEPETGAVIRMKQPPRHGRLPVSGREHRQVRRQQISSGDNPLDRTGFGFPHERVAVGMD